MEQIRRFICIGVTDTVCNLKCSYCYLRCCKDDNNSPRFTRFGVDCETFKRAMSKSRLGGTCMFNFTSGGETVLNPDVVKYATALLEEGHYVEIVTNATYVPAMAEISRLDKKLLSHLMLKCSFHYLELKRLGLLNVFFDNVRTAHNAGASITVELVPTDELIPLRQEIYDLCVKELGAPCHLTVCRNAALPNELPVLSRLSNDEYLKTWEMFDSELFRYKMKEVNCRPEGFCYAGEWMVFMNSESGEVSQCYSGYRNFNIYQNLDAPVPFKAIGRHCRQPYCYNAHAWLTFGCIPGHDAPYYDEVRNRVCRDGTEWLYPEFKNFVHQKFSECNAPYSTIRRTMVNAEMEVRKIVVFLVRSVSSVAKVVIPDSTFRRMIKMLGR